MRKMILVGTTLLLLGGPLHAATFTVKNSKDPGYGSLRWAIEQANASSKRDLITFTLPPRAAYRLIKPLDPLPAMTGVGDKIDGDLNDDGRPDVVLDGSLLSSGNGIKIKPPAKPAASPLDVRVPGCSVIGLSIINFPDNGIDIELRDANTIQSCCIGVDRLGNKALPNGADGIVTSESDYNLIGGDTAIKRNLIATGTGNGLEIMGDAHDNRVIGNYFGLRNDGTTMLTGGGGQRAAVFWGGSENRFGGTDTGEGNVVGYCGVGLTLWDETNALVQGNHFGLAADGSTTAKIEDSCVIVDGGSTGACVGGTSSAAANVFGAASTGVSFRGAGTQDNKVQGNLFGSSIQNTAACDLGCGVDVRDDAGPQLIGGTTPSAGNNFMSPYMLGAHFYSAGKGTTVRYNKFGLTKGFSPVDYCDGLLVDGVAVSVEDNTFRCSDFYGVFVSGTDGRVVAFRNLFHHCSAGVVIQAPATGNLGNVSTTGEGGNTFKPTNAWHIQNLSDKGLKAEGNDFGTTSEAAIDAKIQDKLDDPGAGRVDFDPLMGGVHPSGTASAVAISAATAAPTGMGAQIAFSLSAPATVEAQVLNLAGRPIRAIGRDMQCDAGPNVLLWDARDDRGLRVPGGTYLVVVTARGASGAQARSMMAVRMNR